MRLSYSSCKGSKAELGTSRVDDFGRGQFNEPRWATSRESAVIWKGDVEKVKRWASCSLDRKKKKERKRSLNDERPTGSWSHHARPVAVCTHTHTAIALDYAQWTILSRLLWFGCVSPLYYTIAGFFFFLFFGSFSLLALHFSDWISGENGAATFQIVFGLNRFHRQSQLSSSKKLKNIFKKVKLSDVSFFHFIRTGTSKTK